MRFYKEIDTKKFDELMRLLKNKSLASKLTITFDKVQINLKQAHLLTDAIIDSDLPPNSTLSFYECGLSVSVIKLLSRVLTHKCSEEFEFVIIQPELDKERIDSLAAALSSGLCTRGLKLQLGRTLRTPDIVSLATALQSGQCPDNLSLCLDHNKIDSIGAMLFSKALQSGKCPEGLYLGLSSNSLTYFDWNYFNNDASGDAFFKHHASQMTSEPEGYYGLYHIAKAIKSNFYPSGMSLNIGGDYELCSQIKYIIAALVSETCTKPFSLSLDYCLANVETTIAFAQMLKSGLVPDGMEFHLQFNNFGRNGLLAMSKAIESAKFPKRLKLYLYGHYIERNGGFVTSSREGALAIQKAVESNITILECELTGNEEMNKINLYIKRNKLLMNYPEFAPIIKSLCHQVGLFEPKANDIKSPPKLKILCGKLIDDMKMLKELDKLSLPPDLSEFINQINQLRKELNGFIVKKSVSTPNYSFE